MAPPASSDPSALALVEKHLDQAFERELGLGTVSKPMAREAILDVVEMLLTGQGKEIDEASGAMVFYFNNLTKNASSALRALERFASDDNSGEYQKMSLRLFFFCGCRRRILHLLERILYRRNYRARRELSAPWLRARCET